MESKFRITLYLDDHFDGDYLIALLHREGFEVVSPRRVGTKGWNDEDHLKYCAQHGYAILTANAGDFRKLHQRWRAEGRSHAGIIVVYYEHDVSKNMTLHEIARALKNLLEACEKSGVPIVNEFIVLNQWR
ncbi:MAG: DUF5615 family PIN-like protein [Armatimonadetes bacterium]|nr:DUF5615 family PIN-like protein [Armatimonadota bacterium]